MKQELSDKARNELITYRLQRADQTLEEAKFNASGVFYNAAINRLYYTSYYAVLGLFLKDNITASTHTGVKSMFNLHYILPGTFPRELGKYFSILIENRQSGDYEDFTYYDEEDFKRLLGMTNELLTSIKSYL